MKRLILLLVALVFPAVCAYADTASIAIDNITAAAGSDVTVTAYFTTGDTGITATQYDLSFSSLLSVTNVDPGTAETPADALLGWAPITGGIRVLVYGLTLMPLGSGSLAVMTFHIPDTTPADVYPLTISNIVSSDVDANEVATDGSSGSITITTSTTTTTTTTSTTSTSTTTTHTTTTSTTTTTTTTSTSTTTTTTSTSTTTTHTTTSTTTTTTSTSTTTTHTTTSSTTTTTSTSTTTTHTTTSTTTTTTRSTTSTTSTSTTTTHTTTTSTSTTTTHTTTTTTTTTSTSTTTTRTTTTTTSTTTTTTNPSAPVVRSNGAPTGTLTAGTTQATLSLTTNRNAACRYATTAGVSYDAMSHAFSTTGATAHFTAVTGLANGSVNSYYVRCASQSGVRNSDDYLISFTVGRYALTPYQDFDGDGATDVMLTVPNAYWLLSSSAGSPGQGTARAGAFAFTHIGAGELTAGAESSIVGVRASGSQLKWQLVNPLTAGHTAFASFGSSTKVPIIGCELAGRLMPAYYDATGSTRYIQYVIPGTTKTNKFKIPKNTSAAICAENIPWLSGFYLSETLGTTKRVDVYNVYGQLQLQTPYLPAGTQSAHFFVLPRLDTLAKQLGSVYVAQGQLVLSLYDSGQQNWTATTLPVAAAGIASVAVGNQGGDYRWILVQPTTGQIYRVRLDSANHVTDVALQSQLYLSPAARLLGPSF